MQMNNDSIFERYLKAHNQMIESHGFSERALWGSKTSQLKRFDELAIILKEKKDFSILDLGCGLCDFYLYLKNNGCKNFKYVGLEINPLFVNEAKKRYPDIDIFKGSVNSLNKKNKWDYVVASGIYNLGESTVETEQFFIEQFKALYPNINIGFAVNFLSSLSNNKDKISVYHNPVEVLDICFANFSNNIKLHHNYLPHDFTVFVYK